MFAESITAIQKATMIRGEEEPPALSESSRLNADDRLPRASLGRVEGGDGIVEGRRAVAGAVPGRRVRAHRSKISDQVISPSGAVRRRQAKGWLHR